MRSDRQKIVSTVFLTILLILSLVYYGKNMNTKEVPEIRIAYLFDGELDSKYINPANILTVRQANIIRNLYSRLVEYGVNGEIQGSMASEFYLTGDEASFTIRDFTTKSGYKLSGKDVYYSFLRLLILKSNTHVQLRQFLYGEIPSKLGQSFEGMRYLDNKVVFRLKDPAFFKFFIPALAGVDYSVVPYDSIDWSLEGMPINNFSNSTGAYYLDSQDKGTVTLLANKDFWGFKPGSPKSVKLIAATFENVFQKFSEGSVDFIPTIFLYPKNQLANIMAVGKTVSKWETIPLAVWYLKALSNRISKNHFGCVARNLREHVTESVDLMGIHPTIEFFGKNSAGGLSEDKLRDVRPAQEGEDCSAVMSKIRIAVPDSRLVNFQEVYKHLSYIEFIGIGPSFSEFLKSKMADAYISAIDTTFFEDISSISFNFSIKNFELDGFDRESWVSDYFSLSDRKDRILKFKELHREVLMSGNFFPLAESPFIALAQNGWRAEFIPYFASSPFWQIYHEE